MMDMELENIVANTVYIKAREGESNHFDHSKNPAILSEKLLN